MSVPMHTPQHSVKLVLSTVALEGMLNVLYVQVTDAAVDVHTSGQKTAKRRRTKDEIEKQRGIFFSWGAYAELRTGLCFHLRERGGGRESTAPISPPVSFQEPMVSFTAMKEPSG